MHELSVTESLLSLAVKHAQAERAIRITDVYVVVGQLSSLVDDSIAFYWEQISAGTLAAGARLHFRRVAALFRCVDCGHEYAPAAEELACPRCASLRVNLVAGDELYLEALDVARADAAPANPAPSVGQIS